MSNGEKIWIAQNGQKSGPFTEEEIRRWVAEGRFGPDTLAWRKGMPEWVPLSSLFPGTPAAPPLPPAPKATASAPAVFVAEDRPGPTYSYDERAPAPSSPGASYASHDDYASDKPSRRDLPAPPSLHWGLVLLFSILTLGIFTIVWPFIQANWVKKIDGDSKATTMLVAGLVCLIAGEVISAGNKGAGLGGLLSLAYYVLWYVSYFSMAGSIKRKLADYHLPVEIGGVTLFFFTTFYLQGQLSWISRWKETGSSNPKPPKGAFYFLILIPVFVIAMLAAIAIPAYQGYVKRAQEVETQRGE
jgi:GYF domain 2/Domain of unknown function (DUF4234)